MARVGIEIQDGFLVESKDKYTELYTDLTQPEFYLVEYKYTTGDSEQTFRGNIVRVDIFHTREEAELLAEVIEIHSKYYTLPTTYEYRKAIDKEAVLKPYLDALTAETDGFDEYHIIVNGIRYVTRYIGYFEQLEEVTVSQVHIKPTSRKKYGL